jgi:hypothetical protein
MENSIVQFVNVDIIIRFFQQFFYGFQSWPTIDAHEFSFIV